MGQPVGWEPDELLNFNKGLHLLADLAYGERSRKYLSVPMGAIR